MKKRLKTTFFIINYTTFQDVKYRYLKQKNSKPNRFTLILWTVKKIAIKNTVVKREKKWKVYVFGKIPLYFAWNEQFLMTKQSVFDCHFFMSASVSCYMNSSKL